MFQRGVLYWLGTSAWQTPGFAFTTPGRSWSRSSVVPCTPLSGTAFRVFSPRSWFFLWEPIEANLFISLQFPTPSTPLGSAHLSKLGWEEGPSFFQPLLFNSLCFFPGRTNSSAPLQPLGCFLLLYFLLPLLFDSSKFNFHRPKLKSHKSSQSHGADPFLVMKIHIISAFDFRQVIVFQHSTRVNAVSGACRNHTVNSHSQSPAKWQPSASW